MKPILSPASRCHIIAMYKHNEPQYLHLLDQPRPTRQCRPVLSPTITSTSSSGKHRSAGISILPTFNASKG
ncbi:hypothetical protein VFPPC_18767 [Pochonia chlamydosporia 170]|uniref:Uncharacterized protein n=1 Tax=Pochonia chlamydosporia 170 TaxID=1380566 RepID=A0A219ARV2_METCM|nr:hypothetical protein VFPPC_18767 [Pochonia chlamydosporia 170]OWT43506.1 hypothetical protein VFPPC_18767 [Pochonia chlamydosporia 170]